MTKTLPALLVYLFLACVRVSLAQTPEWVWHRDTNAPEVFFRKTFRIPPQTWNSRLTVSADDEAEIYLNGVSVARCTDWRQPSRSEVTVRLNQGDNVIAVKAANKEGARGLLAHLNVGGNLNVVSDGTWLSTTNEEANWTALSFNAAHWSPVVSLGAHGTQPWGEVLFRPGATAPESIKVAEGFKVELLKVADPEEGSWICLAFDAKGRILVSPQGEQRPLLRLTLEGGKIGRVEAVEAPVRYAMGLLQAFDSLYVNGMGPSGSGLYRLVDANGNDRYETNELHFLKQFRGGGEHGYHGLALGPDRKLYIINGNGTKLPDGIAGDSPYRHQAEDALTGAHGGGDEDGTRAPNCHVLRTDADGKEWELFAGGMRNAYALDFNEDGELFTFDSDNEWHWGVPWYRPTRVVHVVSGGDAGWRDGTRMWAEHYEDAMPTVANVGLGSPTGVKFGRGNQFPPNYQRALFIQDWSYGRIMAVHLAENGATYTGKVETFLEGAPLNVTSLSFGPDGAMYFVTGGRGTQSGLYRVSYQGARPGQRPQPNAVTEAARETRRRLSALHQGASAQDLPLVREHLNSEDRALRFAARVALEAAPSELWREQALKDGALTSLLALARVGTDEDREAVLSRIAALPLGRLSPGQQLAKVRVIEVALARHHEVPNLAVQPLVSELNGAFPKASAELKREIVRVLLQVNAPGAVTKTIQVMTESDSREEELFYVELLRNVKEGWTLPGREKFFAWFLEGVGQKAKGKSVEGYFRDVKRRYVDGASYDGYLRQFRNEALATLSAEERKQLEPLLAKTTTQAHLVPRNARQFVREWKLEDLLSEARPDRKVDLARGRQAFVDAQCLACHRFGHDGGAAGPELNGVGSKYTEQSLLESIIEPSKVVSEQYQDHVVVTKGGDVYTGRLVNQTDLEVVIETDRVVGTRQKIKVGEVESLRPAALSPMPQGLVNVLSREEILDLVAYLRRGNLTTDEHR